MYAYDSFERAQKRVFKNRLENLHNAMSISIPIGDTTSLNDFYVATTAIENDLNKIITDTAYAVIQPQGYAQQSEPMIREILPNIRKASIALAKIEFNRIPNIEIEQLTQIKELLESRADALETELDALSKASTSTTYKLYRQGISTFFGSLKGLISSLTGLLVSSSRTYLVGSGLPRRFM
jgi:hypothetical protein